MYEVDFDRSGEIDFDEFALAMITLKKGALHEGEIQYIKSQKKIYSIFPRLSAKQLKSQAMGGGKASQMAVQQRNTIQETRYQPANLVPDQPRMASREEVLKWSMLQVNYKREEVTGDASPPRVGRLRHQ